MVTKSSNTSKGFHEHKNLSKMLGEGGILSRVLPNYEPRDGQVGMAQAVKKGLKQNTGLVVEAGTGTGKTFAYLLPAIHSGLKIVVSTGTLNLQEQIFYKDLSFFRSKLGLKFRAALMKGRANYLCLRRWKKFSVQPLFDFAWEGKHFERIREWTQRTKTGDRSEIRGLPEKYPPWQRISCSSYSCLGTKCPEFDDCYVTLMRRRAQYADIVVVNHALFFSDLNIRGRAPGVEVIPRYDAVIFDEAHEVQEVATNHFGVYVSTAVLTELVRDIAGVRVPSSEIKPVERSLSGIDSLAKAFFQNLGGRTAGERINTGKIDQLAPEGRKLINSLKELANRFENFYVDADPEAARIAQRADEIASNLEFLIEQPSSEFVYFREARDQRSTLKASPIEIAPIMEEKLYPNVDSVICTSATLSVAGQFDHFRDTMGMDENTACLSAGTSFNPSTQALLYVPRDIPDPNQSRFPAKASERMKDLIELVGARTFLLFTSWRAMDEAWELLEGRLPGTSLKQGDVPRGELLERFRDSPSVLFATISFWQGVDIPGSALSMVVIDKLPFAVPTDPLVEARIDLLRSRGQNPFTEYQIPRAVLLLRQGLGRLLRHREDKGVLALLDRRFHTKAYGKVFRDSLSDHRITDDLKEVETFVNEEGI